MEKITVSIEVEGMTKDELHEVLCKALHENDLSELERIQEREKHTDVVTDISVGKYLGNPQAHTVSEAYAGLTMEYRFIGLLCDEYWRVWIAEKDRSARRIPFGACQLERDEATLVIARMKARIERNRKVTPFPSADMKDDLIALCKSIEDFHNSVIESIKEHQPEITDPEDVRNDIRCWDPSI